jgi:hypothetical protein
MGHIERPESESASGNLQFTRQRVVPGRIARELGPNRDTVGRYLRLAKPAILPKALLSPSVSKVHSPFVQL